MEKLLLPDRFSAVIVRSDGGGRSTRLFLDEKKVRREEIAGDGTCLDVYIGRIDLGCMYLINMGRQTYTQLPLDKHTSLVDEYEGAHWERIQEEELEGEQCDVYRVGIPVPVSRDRKPSTSTRTVYLSKKTGWLRRVVTYDRAGRVRLVTDWLEVTCDPISAAAFEPPLDFDQVSITGKLIKKGGT